MRPHRRQPTRLPRPWDSPGESTGAGCQFLLQCMQVKRESEVAQSHLTRSDPMDGSPPGSSAHGVFQARGLEWGATAFSFRDPSSLILALGPLLLSTQDSRWVNQRNTGEVVGKRQWVGRGRHTLSYALNLHPVVEPFRSLRGFSPLCSSSWNLIGIISYSCLVTKHFSTMLGIFYGAINEDWLLFCCCCFLKLLLLFFFF